MSVLWLFILIESCCHSSAFTTIDGLFSQTQNVNSKVISDENTARSVPSKTYYNPDSIYGKISDTDSQNEHPQDEINKNNVNDGTTTAKISPLVLQPNIADAIDVPGGGLLVPLVIPAVTTANNANIVHTNNPNNEQLMNNSNNTTDTSSAVMEINKLSGEIKRDVHDMDVAEDIVFRPLFKYRQEQKFAGQRIRSRLPSFQNTRYFQPYIYTYKRNL